MRKLTASGVNSKCELSMPCDSMVCGMRYWLAIATFSSKTYPAIRMISMRSTSGPGIVSVTLAVQMKSTLERSTGASRYKSRKAAFCAGSRTSNKADDGSPRKSLPNLSTSSIKMTGFATFVILRAWMIFPGIAPMYVRLWPRISATSDKPPTEKRKSFLSRARATLLPIEVFPTPGGPTRHMIFPCTEPFRKLTAMCSRIRSLTSSKL
mmetsp:Transcript_32840/g.94241  ORF Transcript_32840/g.94241 Transcript_32840/m.94241 type:complete len:209 (-) Transcript_32840:1557-2183(-)